MPGKGLFDNPPENTSIQNTDRIPAWKQSSPSPVNFVNFTGLTSWVRSLFTAGSNVTISNGVISSSSGGSFNVAGGTAVICNTLADMKALTGLGNNTLVTLRGYYSPNDGGGGTFYYLSSSTATANDAYTVAPSNNSGRFFRVIERKQYVNILYFGAKANDWGFDNLAALNAATTYAIANGLDLYIPEGVFRVTGQWLLGFKFATEANGLSENTYTNQTLDNTLFTNSVNLPGGKKRPSIFGVGGKSVIYGDFTPSVETAIIAYCLPGTSDQIGVGGNVRIEGITIAGKNAYSSGNLVEFANYTNLQVGLYMPHSYKTSIFNCCFRSLHYGCAGSNSYWNTWANCIAWKCGVGFQNWIFNAGNWMDLSSYYCDIGFATSVQSACYKNLNTVNCVQDLYLGDFISGMLEAATIDSPNSNNYAIAVGVKPAIDNTASAIHAMFMGINITPRSGNKGILWTKGSTNVFISCSFNGMPIEIVAGQAPYLWRIGSTITHTGAGSSANCINLTP